jgi:hypothetical protein
MELGNLKPAAVRYDGFVKVYQNNFVQTTATSITISGLNGDVDKEYKLEARIVNGYAGTSGVFIRPNNDTGTNYGYQILYNSDATTPAAGRLTDTGIQIASTAISTISNSETTIQAKSGYVRTAIVGFGWSISTTTVTGIRLGGWSWNNTADNITSLVVLASQVGGLGSGSYIALYAKKFHT